MAKEEKKMTAEEIKKAKAERIAKQKVENEKALKADIKLSAEIKEKVAKAKADEKGKVKVEVLKGFGDKFGTDKIKDGTKLNLQKVTAANLIKKGFVKLV